MGQVKPLVYDDTLKMLYRTIIALIWALDSSEAGREYYRIALTICANVEYSVLPVTNGVLGEI